MEAARISWLPDVGSGHREVDLVVGGAGATISGQVVDETGAPVEGAGVMAGPLGRVSGSKDYFSRPSPVIVFTNADGRYDYPVALPEGEQPIAVFASGWAQSSITRTISTEPLTVDVTLSRGATIAGQILRSDGMPAAKASVWIGTSGGRWRDQGYGLNHGITADQEGRYELSCVPSGAEELRAQSRYSESLLRGQAPLSVMTGSTSTVDLTLGEGPVIAGRVLDETGLPVSGLRVKGLGGDGTPYPRAVKTDADGRFRITSLPSIPADQPGAWAIEVFSHGPLQPGVYGLALRVIGGGEIASMGQVEVGETGHVDVGELRIGGGGTLTLTVEIDLLGLAPQSMLPEL